MGRLIDADICEKQLTDFYESSLNEHDAHLFVEFMAQLENVPTAYDVEDVVSELQYMKANFEKDCSYWKEHSWRDNTVYNEADLNDRQADCYSDAIEIVRRGGVE